jgi:hypothetical protein
VDFDDSLVELIDGQLDLESEDILSAMASDPTAARGWRDWFLVSQKGTRSVVDDPKCAARYMTKITAPFMLPGAHVAAMKLLKTVRAGLPQHVHLDIPAVLALKRGAMVYIGNTHPEQDFVLLVAGKQWRVPPGRAIMFPAILPHAGSGELHQSRVYCLFCWRPFTDVELHELQEAAEYLIAVGA